ncbi:DUF1223 domain-containing protein [uncultured Croceitalea sp.]|uniref:DUF1223 domain-containing protein n=1 Tax=uncultured Croceitalea sp. TaxID=1798908 RepID=UPI003305A5E4
MYKKIIIPTLALVALFFIGFISLSNITPNYDKTTATIADFDPIIVLELFTSQGCSSCPPADVLLNKVKEQYPEKVFALSYHVDYWNYIGWEDPFSKAIFTKKQRYYNQKFSYRSNYTPQLVVNGQEHFVGSNGTKLATKISEYGKLQSANSIKLGKVSENATMVNFEYTIDGEIKDKQLRAVLVLDERTTSVKRGENRNRVLKNSNIVVAEKYIELNQDSGKGKIEIPAIVSAKDKITLLLLTENEVADITGAVKKAL